MWKPINIITTSTSQKLLQLKLTFCCQHVTSSLCEIHVTRYIIHITYILTKLTLVLVRIDLNLQEGAIFSCSLNDNTCRRMVVTGLYFIRFSSQNMSVLTTFIQYLQLKKYKLEPNRNLEKMNRNRTVSSEPRVTNILVNRGSPTTVPTLY